MGQNASRAAQSFSDSTKVSRRYRVNKTLPLAPVLSRTNPLHSLPSYLFKISFNINLPSRPRSFKCSLSFTFTAKTSYAFLFSLMRTTSPIHLFLLDVSILAIFALDENHYISHGSVFSSVILILHIGSAFFSSASYIRTLLVYFQYNNINKCNFKRV